MTDTELPDDPLDLARRVLETEAQAILGLIPQLDGNFPRAVDLLQSCAGRVIVTGMGKSGIIARKLAATLSSTGTAATVPASGRGPPRRPRRRAERTTSSSRCRQSGETEELVRLLEAIRRIGARLISLTGDPQSTLGQASDVTLELPRRRGSLPDEPGADGQHDGDARAGRRAGDGAVDAARASSAENFADLHPGGRLGKRLMRVEVADARPATRVPRVRAGHADARRDSRDVAASGSA